MGKEIEIGFHYVSTDAVSGTWEIDNLQVTRRKNVGVDEMSSAVYSATAYSPAHGTLCITAGGTYLSSAAVYDMAGRRVASGSLAGDITLTVAPGVYIVTYSDGLPATKVVVR